MYACEHCNIETKIVYICERCGGRFCSKHKKPENHNCTAGHHKDLDGHELVLETKTLSDEKIEDSEPPLKMSAQILLDEKNEESAPPIKKFALNNYLNPFKPTRSSKVKLNKTKPLLIDTKLVLISFLLVSVLANGYLYLQYQEYNLLSNNYVGLYDTTTKVQGYYDNLTAQYTELRVEYTQLRSLYTTLLENNAGLEKEYSDIINYRKEVQLAYEKTITVLPRQNYSEVYSIPFSGVIDVNYTATGEAYTWIGSSGLESSYYSRNPQFPQTASDYNFTVPVFPIL